MLTVYIAGPMREYPEKNHPAFAAATEVFYKLGHNVVNPVVAAMMEFGSTDLDSTIHIRADIRYLLKCNAIALLPGWEKSTGARCEAVVAMTIGMPFFDAVTGLAMETPRRIICNGGYEQPAGAVDTLDDLVRDVVEWQEATFPGRNPHSITKHLLKEAHELHEDPSDEREWADVFFLTVALMSPGYGKERRDLIAAGRRKLAENKLRTWGAPDSDGVVEHVRDTSGDVSRVLASGA